MGPAKNDNQRARLDLKEKNSEKGVVPVTAVLTVCTPRMQ